MNNAWRIWNKIVGDTQMENKFFNFSCWSTLILICLCFAGCANHIKIPCDARIVWSGMLGNSDSWQNLAWENAGQLFLVDGKSGRVKAVRTIWPEKPTFTFRDLKRNHTYHLYFRADPQFDGKSSEKQDGNNK